MNLPASRYQIRAPRGFTLIEIMIVVGLMGLILTISIPNIYQIAKKEGMRRAINDVKDVCSNARAQAIFSGHKVEVLFYPLERRFSINSAGSSPGTDTETGEAKPAPKLAPGTGLSGTIPEDITLELLDVNHSDYQQSEWTRVRFYPNGTSDELTIIYLSNNNERREIILEPTTALISHRKL